MKLLITKIFKNGKLVQTKTAHPNQKEIEILEKSMLHNISSKKSLSAKTNKSGDWMLASKKISNGDKIKLSSDFTLKMSLVDIKSADFDFKSKERSAQKQIQLLTYQANGVVNTDVLPYKKVLTVSAGSKTIKIKAPLATEWETSRSKEAGLKFKTRIVYVNPLEQVQVNDFVADNKETIMKSLKIYAGIVVAILVLNFGLKWIKDYQKGKKDLDVIKIDQAKLQEKRDKIFTTPQDKIVKPTAQKAQSVPKKAGPKLKAKRIKKSAAKSSRSTVSKKIVMSKSGVKKSKGTISGRTAIDSNKTSSLANLAGSLGINSKAKKYGSATATPNGTAGSFNSRRKGRSFGSGNELGIGGKGGKGNGLGSYKLGTGRKLSIGGYGKGLGTGEGISNGTSKRGVVSGLGDDMTISGGLSNAEILRVINRNMGDINYCYNRRLGLNPSLQGVYEPRFVINSSGRVSTISSRRNTLRDAKVAGCINNAMKKWQFPKPRGGALVKVEYPFHLKTN